MKKKFYFRLMRNSNYEEDQKVFRFINSEYCRDYNDLKKFVIDQNLPLYQRWVFYFYGRSAFLTPHRISDFRDADDINYGPYVLAEVYWWNEYLSFELAEISKIEFDLENANLPLSSTRAILAIRGWKYVEERVKRDNETQKQFQAIDPYEPAELPEYSDYSEYADDNSFCSACEMSPCMCSDREKTSTVHDY